jgi:flavodoxin
MKKIALMMVLATVTLAAVSCGPKKQKQEEQPKPKMLVVYYSQTSNTQKVATEIATRLNADLQEIVPVEPYEGDFEATINRGKKELDEGIFPEIQPLSVKVTDYDIIFIGYPIWFGTYAPPIGTFLNHEDLSGKKLVPFCTFGSGGLESSMRDLYNAEPKATILDGYGVRAARLDAMPKEIDQFLKAGKFLEGEYTQLDDFTEQQPVSEAETAIFEAATGDYPMMHAQAESVASRAIPGGKEYLFVANDLPREDMPDMPPMGPMKVYVTVIEGEAPVFTRVVR